MPSPEYVPVPGGLPDLDAVGPKEAVQIAERVYGLGVLVCEECRRPSETTFCPDCLDLLNGYRPISGRRGRLGIDADAAPPALEGADPMERED